MIYLDSWKRNEEIISFNPNLPDVGNIIRKHLFILQTNPKLKELFPRGSIIPSFRRSKNLKELLAPFCLKTVNEGQTIHHNNDCFKCDRNRCDLCRNFFVESKSFVSFQTGKKYTIHSRISCDSKNVIYLVSFKKCRLQYVGSTATDFRIRFRNNTNIFDQIQTPSGSKEIDRLLSTKEAFGVLSS